MTVAVGDINVFCTIAGNGPHILFLHGWGVGHEAYMPLLAHLQKNFTVFAPDLPGFGKTCEPPSPWSAEDYCSFILAFIKAAGIKADIMMGHSNGGRLLLYMLGRGHMKTQKLVLFDSAGIKPRRKPGYYFRVYSYKALKLLLTPFPVLKKKYMASAGSSDYKAASPLMKGTFSRLVNTFVEDCLTEIKAQTLLIWGRYDTATPLTDAKRFESSIPDAGLVVLEGGHWGFMEQLHITLRVLDSFLL